MPPAKRRRLRRWLLIAAIALGLAVEVRTAVAIVLNLLRFYH